MEKTTIRIELEKLYECLSTLNYTPANSSDNTFVENAYKHLDCADVVKRAIKSLDEYEAEIERLSKCVKTEDEVRQIMKDSMSDVVKEITNEQFDLAEKKFLLALDQQEISVREKTINQFMHELMHHIGDRSELDIHWLTGVIVHIAKEMLSKSTREIVIENLKGD